MYLDLLRELIPVKYIFFNACLEDPTLIIRLTLRSYALLGAVNSCWLAF